MGMNIAPLERLIIEDDSLDGSSGLNRAPANPSEPVVNTDLEAARLFLSQHQATATTLRNYTKEIERMILWSVNVKRKPFSSLSFTDMDDYINFLASPEPVEVWASQRKHPRESDAWRPFVASVSNESEENAPETLVAGLSASSRLTSMATLGSFFTWLVDYGYLIKNPMRQLKTKRKAVRAEKPKTDKQKVERFLDEETWAAFQDAIEMMPKGTKDETDQYERAKFLSSLMLFLAPRASELAAGKMNSFKSDGKLWWWHVVGKGSKEAKVPVVQDMLKELVRYRTYLGLTPLPLDDDDSPLLRSIRSDESITARQLNYILDGLFESAAKLLEQKAEELPAGDVLERAAYQTRAAKVRKASSHWGRHTSITYQIRSGIPKSIVQMNARHGSSNTTDHYTHEDEEHWHKETQKLHN